ncbi:MAG: Cthe_2314 family HEPN domain-containing protein [Syntrophorhabdales bacterium]|jgi:hypothetical protein
MNGFRFLKENVLVKTVLNDGREALADVKVKVTAIELPEDAELDEYQYYVHKVGFYLVHTLTWCKQLDLALEFMSNYDYGKRIQASRADHLIYNIENYLIRLNSVYDRVLQIVNAVFHLCINEESVGHTVIVSNYKVLHRPKIVRSIKAIQKFLHDYGQARHTLIHRHSWLDLRLREIELFYLSERTDTGQNDEWGKFLKHYRANHLREYLAEKKGEFAKVNADLGHLLDQLFTTLLEEYERQKRKLS